MNDTAVLERPQSTDAGDDTMHLVCPCYFEESVFPRVSLCGMAQNPEDEVAGDVEATCVVCAELDEIEAICPRCGW